MKIESVKFISSVQVPGPSSGVDQVPYANATASRRVEFHDGGILMVANGRVEWVPMSNVRSVRLMEDPLAPPEELKPEAKEPKAKKASASVEA